MEKQAFEKLNKHCMHLTGFELNNSSEERIINQLKSIKQLLLNEVEQHYDELMKMVGN